MKQIFTNLYRFEGESPRGERLHSFLLVRDGGNLLLPCQDAPVHDHFEDIEKLGGIDTQFVTHNHDVAAGGLHEAVHERFGARLSYHSAERDAVSEKTGCATKEFGDEGLQLSDDFRAIYFPSCCAGSSIYHWSNGDQHFLFTSHVINRVEGGWNVGLDLWQYRNLRDWGEGGSPPDPRPQLAEIGDLPLDYTMPNAIRKGQEDSHQFSAETREAFSNALGEAIEQQSEHLLAQS